MTKLDILKLLNKLTERNYCLYLHTSNEETAKVRKLIKSFFPAAQFNVVADDCVSFDRTRIDLLKRMDQADYDSIKQNLEAA